MKKYSIILPVRNGGDYVKVCAQSILGQTLGNFNFIVLDNCSTDDTVTHLESLQDERIVIHKSSTPLTIEENWARVTTVNKNEFITLIGHDDVLDATYLETMDKLILSHPNASLFQTHFRFINKDGAEIKKCQLMPASLLPQDLLQCLLHSKLDLIGTGFMMRSIDYDAVGGIPNYPGLLFADFELWMNLTAKGYLAVASNECFAFRLHESTTTTSPDIKMQNAFARLIQYLLQLKKVNKHLEYTIEANSEIFIATHAKGLSHRLLRTPIELRGNLTVKKFLQQCNMYLKSLAPASKFKLQNIWSVWAAQIIDETKIGRWLFLKFKKIYRKPVLK